MEWDVIDSASQAVRKMEIWAIGSGVRAGFESGRTSWLGRKGVSSSTSRLSSNLVRDMNYTASVFLRLNATLSRRKNWVRSVTVSFRRKSAKAFALVSSPH